MHVHNYIIHIHFITYSTYKILINSVMVDTNAYIFYYIVMPKTVTVFSYIAVGLLGTSTPHSTSMQQPRWM